MYYTYILYSEIADRYYIGYTSDLEDRLRHHNSGGTKSTKRGIPWKIICYEEHETKYDAIIREHEIKKKKSRKHIEYLISKNAVPLSDDHFALKKEIQKIKIIDK
jgi:putative endonuclease